MAGTFWGGTCSVTEGIYDVNERKSVTLKCTTDIGSGTIKWFRGNHEYSQKINNPNYKITRVNDEVSLKIKCVDEADGGEYICEIHTFFRVARSPAITLNVWNILHQDKKEQTAKVRGLVTLPCVIKNPNEAIPIVIYWMHNSKQIEGNERYKVEAKPSASLKISDVRPEDAGIYECRVAGTDYPRHSRLDNVILLEIDPTVIIMTKKYVAKIHSNVQLDCEVFGADECIWKHNDKVISLGNIRYTINGDMSLTISPVEQSDEGRYVCEIKNSAGKSVASEEIELYTKHSEYFNCLPEYSEEYRENLSKMQEEEQNKIQRLKAKLPDDKGCVWFIGHYGAGKSSTISSLQSLEDGGISTIALPGGAEETFTQEVSSTDMLGGKVKLFDFPGFQDKRTINESISMCKLIEDKTISKSEGEPLKCCLVYVLDSSKQISKEDIKRMNEIHKFIKEKGNLQMVALLTKIDQASKSATTVQEMLNSQEVCAAVKIINQNVQLPVNCIFEMYNYHKQIDRDSEIDWLICRTFRGLLERLFDIYERLNRREIHPDNYIKKTCVH